MTMPNTRKPPDFAPTTQQFEAALTHEALPAGTRLGGYQVIEVLGRGGFGIVYLALDTSLQRQVAIKEYMPADFAMRCEDMQVWVKPGANANAYAAGLNAFLNEARLLARFDHPSLVRVHSVWEDNRTAYMVMPYYNGRTLTATLKDMQRPPDEAWLRGLLSPLLGALGVLHTAQFLHLDVSPENILVLNDGRPVLLDFGVANRLASDKTLPLTALLNPAYAPIEQYSESASLPQGPWTDLYALAGVMHFAITGQPPARATVRAIEDPQRPLAETVRAMQDKYPGLHYSEAFLSAIDKALAVKPRDRPRDVLSFQARLDQSPFKSPLGDREAPASFQPTAAAAAAPAEPAPATSQPFSVDSFPPAMPASRASFASEPPGGDARAEPVFAPPPRDDWIAADPSARTSAPRRRRAPVWIAGICLSVLAGVAGWSWMQRQPAQAFITLDDLPFGAPRTPAASAVAANPMPPEPNTAPVATAPTDMATQAEASAPATGALPPTAAAADPLSANAPTGASAAARAPAAQPQSQPQTPAQDQAQAPMQPEAASPAPATEPPVKGSPPTRATQSAAAAPGTARKPAAKSSVATVSAASTEAAPAAEPSNPRAVCGSRTNFALLYCMETQCKRPKFSLHAQCIRLKRDGEVD